MTEDARWLTQPEAVAFLRRKGTRARAYHSATDFELSVTKADAIAALLRLPDTDAWGERHSLLIRLNEPHVLVLT